MLFVGASLQNFEEIAELEPGISVQVPADRPTEREQEKGLEPLHDLSFCLDRLLVHRSLKFFFIHNSLSLLFLGRFSNVKKNDKSIII